MIPTLLVDSDPDRLLLLQGTLARHFSLSIAAEPPTALLTARQTSSVMALIWADAPEPDGGLTLCRNLRAQSGAAPLKIILYGAAFDENVLGRDVARQMGVDALLGLPLTPERVKRALRELLAELAAEQKAAVQPAPQSEPPVPQPEVPPPAPARRAAPPVDAATLAALGLSPEKAAELDAGELATMVDLYRRLETDDYYALLGLPGNAPTPLIRKTYFSLARICHPDRYTLIGAAGLRQLAGDVFKRLAEGYQVLLDIDKRGRYDSQLRLGGEKRYTQTERASEGPRAADREIKNPQARKFFNLALSALQTGDLKTAKMNLSFAANLERGNPVIEEKLNELKATGA